MLTSITEYISTHTMQILGQIGTHIGISLFALFVAAVIGIPCGYLASKSEKTELIVSAPFEMFSLEEVPEAHEYMDSSSCYGKIVCVTE